MQEELDLIYGEHRQGLYALALSITRCPERAEDAVQEAFVRLWRSRIEPAGNRVSYVFGAVRNAALDQARRRKLPLESLTSVFEARQSSPVDAAIEAERQVAVRLAVDALSPDQQQVVVLRLYANLTFKQIAEIFGEPLPTVASRYRRALVRIKERLGDSI